MSTLATVTTISRGAHTASFAITVDGVPATTYTLAADGQVTISALAADTSIDVASWQQFVVDALAFIALVDRQVGPPATVLDSFFQREIYDVAAGTIVLRVELGAASFVLSRATWTKAAGTIAFKARAGVTMSWADFKKWYVVLKTITTDLTAL